jgi:site-specific DNA-methyltransferase (adenine-specific)
MGKKWDYDVPSVEVWQECLRVLKPGGHLLAFAGTRTQHRMAVRIEDAGFEIRDMIAWVYGSGFPKSLDVSKAIDKEAGAEREVVGSKLGMPGYSLTDGKGGLYGEGFGANGTGEGECQITAPATEAAKQWAGWGTALKPALEPITVARKPLCGTVAENVLQHGTGGLNVNGCRVQYSSAADFEFAKGGDSASNAGSEFLSSKGPRRQSEKITPTGRWPANLIHDGSDEVVGLFPETTSGDLTAGKTQGKGKMFETCGGKPLFRDYPGDTGSAARFFYCAKADASERRNSKHPTVKPLALMRYLCRLVCPPDGLVLDPFCGSGTTLEAARLEGFGAIGCELNAEYIQDCKERLKQGVLF